MTKPVALLWKYLPLAGAMAVPFLTLILFPELRSWDVKTFSAWMRCLGAAQGPDYSPCLPDLINYPAVGLYLSAGVMLLLEKVGVVASDIPVFYQRFLAVIDSLNLVAFYLLLRGLGIRYASWSTLIFSLLPSTRVGASLWVQIDSVTQLFLTSAFLFGLRGLSALERSDTRKAQRYLFGLGAMISCALLTKQLAIFALPPLVLLLVLLAYRLAQRTGPWVVATNMLGVFLLTVSLDRVFPTPPGYFGSGLFYVLSTGSNHANVLSANGANIFSLLPGDQGRSSLDFIELLSLGGLTIRVIPFYAGIGWFIGLSAIFFVCGIRLALANQPLSPRAYTLYALTFAAFLSLLMNTVLSGTHERYLYHYGFFVYPVLLTLVTLSRSYLQPLFLSTVHLTAYGFFVLNVLRQSDFYFRHAPLHGVLVFLNGAFLLFMLFSVAIAAKSPARFCFSLEERDKARMSTRAMALALFQTVKLALVRLCRGWVFLWIVTFVPYFFHFTLKIQPLSIEDLPRLALWCLFAAVPYAVLPLCRVTLMAIALPLVVLGVCEIFHAVIFNGRVSVATVFVTVQTNWREVSEFLQVYFTAAVIVAMVSYLVVVPLYWRKVVTPAVLPRKRSLILFVTYLACVFVALRSKAQPEIEPPGELPQEAASQSWWPEVLGPFDESVRALEKYYTEIFEYRQEARKRKTGLVSLQADASQTTSREVHVVVIGESINRNHMGLYGYSRDTTPRLSAMKNSLFVFSDVISTFSHTLEAVKSALTFAGPDKDKKLHQVYSIIDVARKAGFRTYWISNQPPIGIWDNEISILAQTADESIFVNRSGDSVAACDTHSPDERVLKPLDIALRSESHDKIVVFVHLMGAHAQYHFRYPERFSVFTDLNSIPNNGRAHLDTYQRKTINAYDNAILYNDWVVSQIIQSVDEASQRGLSISSLVYFSDHGEEVYESRAYQGHGWDNLGRHHFEVPFFVWLSDGFQRARPQTVQAIRANLKKTSMTSSLIFGLIDLMGINTPLQQPQQSLFSPEYQPGSRVVYNVNYDLRLRQKP